MSAKSLTGGRKHRRSMRKMKRGGAGGADWATNVYGGIGQQHSVAGSNVIAMNNGGTPVPLIKTGGSKIGGNIVSDLAVPAVLLYANNMYNPKKGRNTFRKRSSLRRSRRSRRYRK